MTKKEMAVILATLKEAFRDFQITENKANLWYELLGDLDFQATKAAVAKLILTATFPPSIAEIRKTVVEVTGPRVLTGAEALEEVTRAVREYGIYDVEAAFNSMSPLAKRVVKTVGWSNICTSESPEVWRGEFLKLYSQLEKQALEENILPEGLKTQIKELQGRVGEMVKELAERRSS